MLNTAMAQSKTVHNVICLQDVQ